MNRCFDNYPEYKCRSAVASYSRRTRTGGIRRQSVYDTLIALCCAVLAFLENDSVRTVFRIAVSCAAMVSFALLISAVDTGALGFGAAFLASVGIVAGCGLAFKI